MDGREALKAGALAAALVVIASGLSSPAEAGHRHGSGGSGPTVGDSGPKPGGGVHNPGSNTGSGSGGFGITIGPITTFTGGIVNSGTIIPLSQPSWGQ